MPSTGERWADPSDAEFSVEAAAVIAGVPVGAGAAELEQAQQASVVGAAEAAVSLSDGGSGAQAALLGVLRGVPVAVLVIDQSAGEVVHANAAAIELAGNISLPVPVDAWGASAGLTDLAGSPLAGTDSPLSQVAAGQPVAGGAVRLAPHRSSNPQRAVAADGGEQLLWVTGFPLSTEGSSGPRLSLVVFLQLQGADIPTDGEVQLQALRERAVIATDIAFTLTDPRQPDDPLVWVNPSFSRITGYAPEDAVGRNCRFLQGPATDQSAVQRIGQALRARQPITETLLNYRPDRTAFWNQVSITPVFDSQGTLVSFVGVQVDVTERVRVDGERAAALRAESAARRDAELARADAERAQQQLALVAEATSTLSATLHMTELLESLAGLCVPQLADGIFLTLVDEHGTVRDTAFRHRKGMHAELQTLSDRHAAHLPDSSPTRRTLRTSQPVLVQRVTPQWIADLLPDPVAAEAFQRLGVSSVLTVPLIARRRTLGVMALLLGPDGRSFTPGDVELAGDLSRRAAMVMDNVRLYEREHTVAETLQQSLLPQLPDIPRLTAATAYLSASTGADVGGDFYDLLQLPDGTVGIAIGDVVGHDVTAAAAMGHLRGLLRACAWEASDNDPAAVLARVDRLVQGLHIAPMATMTYLRATPPIGPDHGWSLHAANAGHPPLLLRHPDGTVAALADLHGMLIGVDVNAYRPSRHLAVPVGTTLIAYTDGLIEQAGQDLDEGIAALIERLTKAPADATPTDLCRQALGPTPNRQDDIAVLTVRLE